MIEYSVFGIVGLVILFGITITLTWGICSFALKDNEPVIAFLMGAIAMSVIGLFGSIITVKTVSVDAKVSHYGQVGPTVVFIVDGTTKTYNDIYALQNMKDITFKRVNDLNVFGYTIGTDIKRVK